MTATFKEGSFRDAMADRGAFRGFALIDADTRHHAPCLSMVFSLRRFGLSLLSSPQPLSHMQNFDPWLPRQRHRLLLDDSTWPLDQRPVRHSRLCPAPRPGHGRGKFGMAKTKFKAVKNSISGQKKSPQRTWAGPQQTWVYHHLNTFIRYPLYWFFHHWPIGKTAPKTPSYTQYPPL